MRKERRETILSETGKVLVDIAKLVFGGVILAGIMKYESVNSALLYGIGGAAVAACFISGLILLTLSKREKYMGLIIFLSVVGVIALCIGVWGAVQLHHEAKVSH